MSNYRNLDMLANLYSGLNKQANQVDGEKLIDQFLALNKALQENPEDITIVQKFNSAKDVMQRAGLLEAAKQKWDAMNAAPAAPAVAPANEESLWDKIKSTGAKGWDWAKDTGAKGLDWAKENPGLATAIGAGAIGLGSLGAYAALNKDDEEEEQLKQASYQQEAMNIVDQYFTKLASVHSTPKVAAGVTGVSNYINIK